MSQKTQGTQLWYVKDPSTLVRVEKVTAVTGGGGGIDQIEDTDLDSVEKEFFAGLPSPGALSVPLNFDPKEVGHRNLYALWQSGERITWVIGLSDGTAPPTITSGTITYPTTRTFLDFKGYIADMPIDAAGNSKMESAMTVQRSGPKTPHWKTLS